MLSIRLYMLQRITALIMVPLVIGHIAVMIYAVQGGLSAAEILARTKGSFGWFAFYGLFVASVSVHATIGLRTIAHEFLGLKDVLLNLCSWAIFALLLILGTLAVVAVTV